MRDIDNIHDLAEARNFAIELALPEGASKQSVQEIKMAVVIGADLAARKVFREREQEARENKWGEDTAWNFCGAVDPSKEMTTVALSNALQEACRYVTDLLEVVEAHQVSFDDFLMLVGTHLRDFHYAFKAKSPEDTLMIDKYSVSGDEWKRLETDYKMHYPSQFEIPFTYEAAEKWVLEQQEARFGRSSYGEMFAITFM